MKILFDLNLTYFPIYIKSLIKKSVKLQKVNWITLNRNIIIAIID